MKAIFVGLPLNAPRLVVNETDEGLSLERENSAETLPWNTLLTVELFRAPFWVRAWESLLGQRARSAGPMVIAATFTWDNPGKKKMSLHLSAHGLRAIEPGSGWSAQIPDDCYLRYELFINRCLSHARGIKIRWRPFAASFQRSSALVVP